MVVEIYHKTCENFISKGGSGFEIIFSKIQSTWNTQTFLRFKFWGINSISFAITALFQSEKKKPQNALYYPSKLLLALILRVTIKHREASPLLDTIFLQKQTNCKHCLAAVKPPWTGSVLQDIMPDFDPMFLFPVAFRSRSTREMGRPFEVVRQISDPDIHHQWVQHWFKFQIDHWVVQNIITGLVRIFPQRLIWWGLHKHYIKSIIHFR